MGEHLRVNLRMDLRNSITPYSVEARFFPLFFVDFSSVYVARLALMNEEKKRVNSDVYIAL